VSAEERRERTAVYDGWWRCETLEDVEEQERLVDRWAERNPGTVDRIRRGDSPREAQAGASVHRAIRQAPVVVRPSNQARIHPPRKFLSWIGPMPVG
jgi:hypothetical protein